MNQIVRKIVASVSLMLTACGLIGVASNVFSQREADARVANYEARFVNPSRFSEATPGPVGLVFVTGILRGSPRIGNLVLAQPHDSQPGVRPLIAPFSLQDPQTADMVRVVNNDYSITGNRTTVQGGIIWDGMADGDTITVIGKPMPGGLAAVEVLAGANAGKLPDELLRQGTPGEDGRTLWYAVVALVVGITGVLWSAVTWR